MKLISNNEQLLIVQLMLSRNSGAVTTKFFSLCQILHGKFGGRRSEAKILADLNSLSVCFSCYSS